MREEKIIKTPPVAFLKVDEIIQKVIGIFILLTLIVYPIAMLLLIPYGAWQVVSGIVGALYGSKWRMKYLGIVAIYFSTYYFGYLLGNRSSLNEFVEVILMGIYCITPLVLGIGYLVKTRQELPKEEGIKPQWKDMDDILDMEMVS